MTGGLARSGVARLRRRPLEIGAGGLCGGLAALSLLHLSERTLAVAVLVALFALGLRYPTRLPPWVFAWTLVAGAVRKWLLPQLQDLVFLAAIPALAGAYSGYVLQRVSQARSLIPAPLAPPWLMLLVIWNLGQAIHPQLPDWRVGVLGIIVRLFFIPLAYLTSAWLSSKGQLFRALKMLAVFAVPLLVLGCVQYVSPHHSPINAYVWGGDPHKAAGGGAVRVTATFPFIWGYAVFLQLLSLVLLVLLSVRSGRPGSRLLWSGLLAGTVLNLFMTGTRSAIAFVGVYVAAFLLLALVRGRLRPRIRRRPLLFALACTAIALVCVPAARDALHNFADRVAHATDTTAGRIRGALLPFEYLDEAGLTGFGLGSTYQGSRQVVSESRAWQHMPRGFEEEPERLLIELGLVGYVLTYLVRFALVLQAWRCSRTLRDPDLRTVALAVGLFLLPAALHLEMHADNLDRELYLWLAVGVLAALPRLDAQQGPMPDGGPPDTRGARALRVP